MAVFTSAARDAFYNEIWQRALIDGRNLWCQSVEESGIVVLVPHDDEDTWLARWPILPEDDPWGKRGWIPTSDKIQAAFTAILHSGGPRVYLDYEQSYQARLAEQHVNAEELPVKVCDRVLQVAVFGKVVFR